jgi:DNA-binding NarL/FixJ family response regulator
MFWLVVDDHELVRLGISQALRLAFGPVSVVGVTSCEEARNAFDVEKLNGVVLDHILPDGLGSELVKWIRNRSPNLPLVVYSQVQNLDQLFDHEIQLDEKIIFCWKGDPLELFLEKLSRLQLNSKQEDTAPTARTIRISPRQQQVLLGLCQGKTVRFIAEDLGCSEETVRTHKKVLMLRAGTSNTASLVAMAIQKGWVQV